MNQLNIYLFIISVALFVILIIKNEKKLIFRPKIILSFLLLLFVFLGNINLIFYQNVIGWYQDIKSELANFYALLGYIIFVAILLIGKKGSNQNRINQTIIITDKGKIYRFVIILSVISILFNVVNLSAIGGNIFLRNSATGFERFNIDLPFPKGLILSSFLLTISSIQFFIDSKRKVNYVFIFFINLVFSSAIGSRHLVIMPLIPTFFFLAKVEYIKAKYFLISIIIGFVLLIGLSLGRGDSKFEGATNWQSFQGNEYRDYIRLTNEANLKYEYGSTISSIVFNAIPKQIYSILEFDKDNYRIYSAYVLSDLWGNSTGQRPGIWGEFYLNFGYSGLMICFVLFGFIVRYFDEKLITTPQNRNEMIIILSYVYGLFIFSILGSWATIGDDIGSYGLLHFIFFFISTRKYKLKKKAS